RRRTIRQSADIGAGDRLVASGIGGRFRAGFPVAVVENVRPYESGLFMLAEARPTARLDRGVEVLLVANTLEGVDDGPPLPPPPPEPEPPSEPEAPAADASAPAAADAADVSSDDPDAEDGHP